MRNTRWIALIVVLAGAAWAAQKKAPPAHARAAGNAPVADAELEKAIRTRFADSKISVNHFQVRVQGGVATIEGKTDILQHKGTATRLAKSVGAVRVVNKVEVSQAARDRAAAGLAKGRRRVQVKRSEPR